MKDLIENWRGLISDQEGEERICIDREAFDRIMKLLGDEYKTFSKGVLENDERATKIDKLCRQYGYKQFIDFLKTINAWELAQKGNLYKNKK